MDSYRHVILLTILKLNAGRKKLPGRKIPLDTASRTRLNASPGATGPKLLPIAFSHNSSIDHPVKGLKAATR